MEITFDVIFIFRFAIALIRNGVENEWIKKKIDTQIEEAWTEIERTTEIG